MPRKITLSLFFIMFVLTAQQAFTADSKTGPDAETEKEGQEFKAKRLIRLDPIVISPLRSEEAASNVSKSVTVISKEDIGYFHADSLPDLVQNYSGVSVANYYGNPKGTVVDIRGFGEASLSNVLVLIDGRRTNQIDLSGVDWAQIDLNSVEKIEIVRGAATVLHGDNAAAGVINIVTKRGSKEEPVITVGGQLGSYQYKKGFASLSGKSDFMDFYSTYSYQDTSGYRANNDYLANDGFCKVTVYPTDMFEMQVEFGAHSDRYGMPGSLLPSTLHTDGRRGTRWGHDRGWTTDWYFTATPKFIFSIGDHEAVFSVFNSYRDRRSKGLSVYTPGTFEYETVHHINTYELRPKIELELILGSAENRLIAGMDYFYAKDSILSGNRLGARDRTDIRKQTLGVYIHESSTICDKFLFNAGCRAEWAYYKFDQNYVLTGRDTKHIKDAAFNIGAGYKYRERSQVYFDFSRSYRMPNTEEYYVNKYIDWWTGAVAGGLNTSIKNQDAYNYEVGVKDTYFDWMSFSAALFLIDVKNEIYFDPSTYQNMNYKPLTRHYGAEFAVKFDLFKEKFKPYAFLTLQESYFKGGTYAGNMVPFVPKVKFVIGATVSPIKNLNWTTALRYVGSRYMISDQNNIAPKLEAHTILDTTLEYKYKWVRVWMAIRNLFNKKYYAYAVSNNRGAETLYPAPERSFEFGVSVEY